jgi:hypothetical protein
LTGHEAVRSSQVAKVTSDRVHPMEFGESVDDGVPDPPSDIDVLSHRRRDDPPDDFAAAVLDDKEVRAND